MWPPHLLNPDFRPQHPGFELCETARNLCAGELPRGSRDCEALRVARLVRNVRSRAGWTKLALRQTTRSRHFPSPRASGASNGLQSAGSGRLIVLAGRSGPNRLTDGSLAGVFSNRNAPEWLSRPALCCLFCCFFCFPTLPLPDVKWMVISLALWAVLWPPNARLKQNKPL